MKTAVAHLANPHPMYQAAWHGVVLQSALLCLAAVVDQMLPQADVVIASVGLRPAASRNLDCINVPCA